MGKVLKVVAIVVAVAVIVFAPYLGPGLLAGIGISGLAASAIIATAMIASSMALSALTAKIAKPNASMATAPLHSYPQGTAIVRGGIMSGAGLPLATQRTMAPKRDHWLRHFDLWDVRRFHLTRVVGDCMAPIMPDGWWGIVDLEAEIRRGDLFVFDVRDREAVFPRAKYGKITGLIKEFRGINSELGFLEVECTQPPSLIHTGLSNLRHAHRLRAIAPTWEDARELLRSVRRDPAAFDASLGK